METVVEEGRGLTLGAFVGFFLAHEDFNLLGQQSANGGVAPGGDDLSFTNGLAVQADGDILLHSIPPLLANTHLTCDTYVAYTTYYTYVQEKSKIRLCVR